MLKNIIKLLVVAFVCTSLPAITAWGITKGTTWCGVGNVSFSDTLIQGTYTSIDRCCKDHDACPHSIHGLSSNFNYYNYRLFTISDCYCDEVFRVCLKHAGSLGQTLIKRKAKSIGRIFFNNPAAACFQLQNRKVCHDFSPFNIHNCTNFTTEPRVTIYQLRPF